MISQLIKNQKLETFGRRAPMLKLQRKHKERFVQQKITLGRTTCPYGTCHNNPGSFYPKNVPVGRRNCKHNRSPTNRFHVNNYLCKFFYVNKKKFT